MARPRNLIIRMALVLVAVLVGYLVVREGFARVATRTPAMLAMAARVAPHDARVQTELAELTMARAGLDERLQSSDPALMQRAGRQAAEALESDLTRVDAMAIVGLAAHVRGDEEAAAAAMRAAESLSRRNLATRMWLIQDAGRRGELAEMLAHIDISLRTSANAQNAMFPLLAQTLAEDALVPDYIRLLEQEPEWAEPFLYTAIASGHGTRNLARIYLALGKEYQHDGQDLSELLMQALVAQRDFATAFALNEGLTGSKDFGREVEDPSFSRHRGLEPFTWVLTATADFDAVRSEDPFGRPGLAVTSTGSGAEVVAAQLLRLQPGRYRFRNTVSSDAAELRLIPQWRLRCADDNRELGTFDPRERELAQWTVPGDCRFQWLELRVDAGNTITGESMFVGPVELTQLGGSS